MTDSTIANNVRKGGGVFLLLGILTLLLGIAAIGAPFMAGLTVTIVTGSLLLVSGLFQVFHGFKILGSGAKVLAILVGVLTVAAGIIILKFPMSALATLTLILAGFFVVDGILTSVAAIQSRANPGWGFLLFNGLVTLLLGFLIWRQWPVSGVWAIGILIGVRILMTGISMIFLGAATRQAASEMGD